VAVAAGVVEAAAEVVVDSVDLAAADLVVAVPAVIGKAEKQLIQLSIYMSRLTGRLFYANSGSKIECVEEWEQH
jgi:hypothetical protein